MRKFFSFLFLIPGIIVLLSLSPSWSADDDPIAKWNQRNAALEQEATSVENESPNVIETSVKPLEVIQTLPNSKDLTLQAEQQRAQMEAANQKFKTIRNIGLIIILISLIAMWMVFNKAGRPGWAILIPIYNLYVLLQIVGRPGWWLLLMFIPAVNFLVTLIIHIDLARVFGKSWIHGIGLTFLPFFFYPILAFGSAKYEGEPPSLLG